MKSGRNRLVAPLGSRTRSGDQYKPWTAILSGGTWTWTAASENDAGAANLVGRLIGAGVGGGGRGAPQSAETRVSRRSVNARASFLIQCDVTDWFWSGSVGLCRH